jgi:hypothetical protein
MPIRKKPARRKCPLQPADCIRDAFPALSSYSPECVEVEFCEVRLLGILRSSHTRSSRKFAEPRSNTCEHTWLRSAAFGYYRTSAGFLIIPSSCALPHGSGRAIGPENRALHVNFSSTEQCGVWARERAEAAMPRPLVPPPVCPTGSLILLSGRPGRGPGRTRCSLLLDQVLHLQRCHVDGLCRHLLGRRAVEGDRRII